MRKELRPYQQDAFDATIEALENYTSPVLLNMATGSGKSLMNSFLAEYGASNELDVLCITSFAELVAQNSEEMENQGTKNSIFCSKLGQKKFRSKIVVATPQSLWETIKEGSHPLRIREFGLILIDEVHRVNPDDNNTVYMKILNHYRSLNHNVKICGFSGSCMRGIDDPIYGEGKMFEKLNYSISFSDLVKMGFLVPPRFGSHKDEDEFDFSEVNQNKSGRYDKKQVESIASDNSKTTRIIKQVVENTKLSHGTFIFCATAEQCEHVMSLLPDTARLITGTMNDKDRMKAMAEAKAGKVKYLVNINCLTTGINLPHFEDIVYLRLTESPIFFIQSIGRGSRLCESTNKSYFTVWDYAGNCDKFQGINDEALAGAILEQDVEKQEAPLDIECELCHTMNTRFDRRCRGFNENSVRCEKMFIFRECICCREKCDIAAKVCPHCGESLFDYNKKLNEKAYTDKKTVFNLLSQEVTKHFNFKLKKDIIKINYITDCGTLIASHYDPTGKTRWQRDQWHSYLVENGMPKDNVAPTDIDRIVDVVAHNLSVPVAIEATKNGKYYNIVSRVYYINGNLIRVNT